jgi:hypothetical protein
LIAFPTALISLSLSLCLRDLTLDILRCMNMEIILILVRFFAPCHTVTWNFSPHLQMCEPCKYPRSSCISILVSPFKPLASIVDRGLWHSTPYGVH